MTVGIFGGPSPFDGQATRPRPQGLTLVPPQSQLGLRPCQTGFIRALSRSRKRCAQSGGTDSVGGCAVSESEDAVRSTLTIGASQ